MTLLIAVPLLFAAGNTELPGLPVQPAQLAAALAVVAVLALRLADLAPLVPSPVLVAWVPVVLLAFLSTVVAPDPPVALRMSVNYLLGLALAAAVAAHCRTARRVWWLLGGVCAAALVTSVLALGELSGVRVAYGGSVVDARPTALFGQPNELGAFTAVGVVLAFALVAGGPRRFRLPAAACGLVAVGGLVASLSRGAWIGAAVGLAVLAVLLPQCRRLALGAGAALVGCGALLAVAGATGPLGVAAQRLGSLLGTHNPYDDRPAIWAEAVGQIARHPLLGSGPGGFAGQAAAVTSPVAGVRPVHAHNLVLTVLTEQGLLGLAALGVAVATGAWVVAKTRPNPEWGAPVSAAAAGLAAFGGQGLVDHPLANPVLGLLMWLLVGVVAAGYRGRAARYPRSTQYAGLGVRSRCSSP